MKTDKNSLTINHEDLKDRKMIWVLHEGTVILIQLFDDMEISVIPAIGKEVKFSTIVNPNELKPSPKVK